MSGTKRCARPTTAIIPVHQSGDGRPARHCYHTAQHQTGETPVPGKGVTTAAQDANTYNFVSLGLPPIIPVHQSGDGRPARHCYHTAQHQTGETPVPRQKCRAQKDVPDLQLEQTWQGSTAVTLHSVFRRSRMESIDGFYQQEPDSA